MKRTRITYDWKADTIYSFVWTLIFLAVFELVLRAIENPDISFDKRLLSFNLLAVPLSTIFIGLRPVISLFTLPDTLYLNDSKQLCLTSGDIIEIDNIKSLEINQVGFGQGYLLYYELTFFDKPRSLNHRKRSSLILIEPYHIKYIFQTRTDLIDKLIDIGLSKKVIQWKPQKTKHLFGIRDRFKK